MKESKSGLIFTHWVRANRKKLLSGSYEIKDSRGTNIISFKEIGEEQLNHALATSSETGDLIRVQSGTVGAADYVFLRNATAWFVCFYPGEFHLISVGNLIFEKEKHKRKSLTANRAKAVATISVKL